MSEKKAFHHSFEKKQLSGCKRFILHTSFFCCYTLCLYLAAQKGTAVETIGAIIFLTLALNIPSKQYRVMFSRHGVYEGESPLKSWIVCKIFAMVFDAKGDGRDAFIVNAAE